MTYNVFGVTLTLNPTLLLDSAGLVNITATHLYSTGLHICESSCAVPACARVRQNEISGKYTQSHINRGVTGRTVKVIVQD